MKKTRTLKLNPKFKNWALMSFKGALKNDERYSNLTLIKKVEILKKETFKLGLNENQLLTIIKKG